MHKLIFIPLLLLCSIAPGQTGPTKTDLEKMQKELIKQQHELLKQQEQLQQEINKAMADPEVKKAMQQAGFGNATYTSATAPATIPPPSIPATTPVRWGKLPVLNAQRLAAVPKEVLSAEALKSYLQDLGTRIDKSLPAPHKQAVDAVVKQADGNALTISRSAVMAWYKKSPHVALALAAKSGVLAPADPEVLNTLGAILNLCGFEHKALPILQYLNSQIPGNSTVVNNIGQAYLGLGDQKKAEEYLLMCVAQTPHHTEANKSLGMIYHAQGNMPKARECFQNSLKGGYSETAFAGAGKTGKVNEPLIFEFISGRHGKPEYFNAYKYNFPPLCETVSSGPELMKQHQEFRFFLEKQRAFYHNLAQEAVPKFQKQQAAYVQKITNTPAKFIISPLSILAARTSFYYFKKQAEDAQAHAEWISNYRRKKEKLQTELEKRLEEIEKEINKKHEELASKVQAAVDAGGGVDEDWYYDQLEKIKKDKCSLVDPAHNNYLMQLAQLHRQYIAQVIRPEQEYVQQLIYWKQFYSQHGDYETTVYSLILNYMSWMSFMVEEAEVILPACYEEESTEPEGKAAEEEELKRDCSINFNINVLIASMSMDCEKFGINVNAGLSFSAEKNFITKETTLAIGAGIGTTKGGNIPLVGIEGKVGASGQFYIVFDGNNNPSDVGMKFSAGASVSTSVGVGAISTETGSLGAEAGYTLGLNSGWNFGASALGTTYQL